MILAPLADANRYAALHPLFAQAFAWLSNPANLAKPMGKIELIADHLRVIIDETNTEAAAQRKLECHRKYIDIQFNISGGEIIEWTPIEGLSPVEPFNTERDICFFHEPQGPVTRLMVKPGWFAIFFPEDAHKPLCNVGNAPHAVKKIVFKIAV